MEGSSTSPVATAITGDGGAVEFTNLRTGNYHVVVSGDGIERTESGTFELDARKMTQSQDIYVHPQQSAAQNGDGAGGPMVSALDLKVPPDASKEFKKGNDAIAHEDWKKAEEHFNRAVEIYPQYAAAFTNLAVVYGRLSDAENERAMLQKAIAVNDHFAPAYFNLAVLSIRQKSYAEAESLLLKADQLDPTNAKSLMLLAETQLFGQQYGAAIATAQRVHSLPHQNLALVHVIAAHAYEHQNHLNEAAAELQVFLKEEPQGPRADLARDELKAVQRQRQ